MSELSDLQALVAELTRKVAAMDDWQNRFRIAGPVSGKGNSWALTRESKVKSSDFDGYTWIGQDDGFYAWFGLGTASFVSDSADELLGLNIDVTTAFSLIAGDGASDGLGFTLATNNSWLDYDSLTITGPAAKVSLIDGLASSVATPNSSTFTDASDNESVVDAEGILSTASSGAWSHLTGDNLTIVGTGTTNTLLDDGGLTCQDTGTGDTSNLDSGGLTITDASDNESNLDGEGLLNTAASGAWSHLTGNNLTIVGTGTTNTLLDDGGLTCEDTDTSETSNLDSGGLTVTYADGNTNLDGHGITVTAGADSAGMDATGFSVGDTAITTGNIDLGPTGKVKINGTVLSLKTVKVCVDDGAGGKINMSMPVLGGDAF